MSKLKRLLLISLLFAFVYTGFSYKYTYNIGEGSFFLSTGDPIIIHGRPFGYWKCYDIIINPYGNTGCLLMGQGLVLDLLFWFAIGFMILLIGTQVFNVFKKISVKLNHKQNR
ncbi:hypothetical protein COV24_00435 [candidate division WWE3 bacterium CG10_big_fil_rev_8_21_14_0_10_32_10]|uniref:Uncharacterized protein n=1 Tax=candidate division WWE3 bacterium CG10_big_fil_rev_8_21_14_0_10_32_10 TaxID=1975090 RepID=A0A2H0RBL5_UNCKA|nr:MAG: hypothetical protein COV24_00435 [candidate division WWE3 bacterium CG10_big_fil_rev_8_21_14_0_10_32_10]